MRCNRETVTTASTIIRIETAVVSVPMAKSVGEVALEMRA